MRAGLRYGLIWAILLIVAGIIDSCDTPDNVDPVYKDYFIKYFGSDGQQEGKAMVVNTDGTIVLLGTWTDGSGRKRVYVVKTDSEGNVLWDRTLGGLTNEVAADLQLITQGPDAGNLVVLSNYTKNAIDSMALRLTIVSQSGDSLKGYFYNRYASQVGNSVTTLSDGGYYISAQTTDPTGIEGAQTIQNALLIRVNSSLVQMIDHGGKIDSPSLGSAGRVIEISPTLFYYGGHSDEAVTGYDPGKSNFYFRAFDNDPSSILSIFPAGGTDTNEEMAAIARSPAGPFMALGTMVSGNNRVMIAARVSASFSAVSPIQTILSNAEGVAVAPSEVTNFLLLGNAFGSGGNRDIMVKKIDAAFSEIMTVRFGGSNNDDTGHAITELPNGDILILGTMELVNQKKMALIKVNAKGKF